MTMTHFAGLNTAFLAEALEGRPVLVSFADILRRPGVWQREILPRLERGAYPSAILDSGAFTELTTPGFSVDVEAYAAFCAEHGHLFSQIVTLDDIRGDVQRTKANTEALEAAGAEVVPVFHQGEDWAVLDGYLARYKKIGVGFQRPIKGAEQFLEQFFQRVAAFAADFPLLGRPEIHGFGMTRHAMAGWPFDTTDSTTWIAEARALLTEKKGTHSAAGWTSGRRDDGFKAAAYELVLASYEADHFVADQLDEESRAVVTGQARTVLNRFSQFTLDRTLDRLGAAADAFRGIIQAYGLGLA